MGQPDTANELMLWPLFQGSMICLICYSLLTDIHHIWDK